MFKPHVKMLTTITQLLPSDLKTLAFIILLATFSNTTLADKSSGFTPNVELEIQEDNNIRRTENSVAQSDTIFALKPKLKWLGLLGKHKASLNYKGDYGLYSDNDELNYDDHSLKVHGLFDHTLRLNTEIELGISRDHDDPGSTNAASILEGELHQLKKNHIQGKLYYGTNKSIGQFVLQAVHAETRYTDTEQSFRDFDRQELRGTFFYRIAPKTRLLLEGASTTYDYQANNQTGFDQSSDDIRYILGAEWNSTAKTTGIFKVGHSKKEYNRPTFDDISGLTLSLDIIWQPNTYTRINIGAIRDTKESAQALTSGYVSEEVQTKIDHQLTPQITLTANAEFIDEQYSNAINRNDKRKDFGIGLKYAPRKWLNMGLDFHIEERDSNLNSNDYRANIVTLSISTTLD